MPELGNEEKIKKTLEDFDWSVLFSDTKQSGLLATLLPWLSIFLQIAILIMIWKK